MQWKQNKKCSNGRDLSARFCMFLLWSVFTPCSSYGLVRVSANTFLALYYRVVLFVFYLSLSLNNAFIGSQNLARRGKGCWNGISKKGVKRKCNWTSPVARFDRRGRGFLVLCRAALDRVVWHSSSKGIESDRKSGELLPVGAAYWGVFFYLNENLPAAINPTVSYSVRTDPYTKRKRISDRGKCY